MRRIRGPHARRGFTVVEVVVTVTILALVVGVLIDVLIVGLRGPKHTKAQLDPAETELVIARFVSADVLPSFGATPGGTACGVTDAALVTKEKSVATAPRADRAIAYSLGPAGLVRSTCATDATTATTTTIISPDVTAFVATCRAPGACGTVHVEAASAVNGAADHQFSLDVARKQK